MKANPMSEFTREIKFIPIHEKLDLKFILRGEKGVMQFCIATGWHKDMRYQSDSNSYAYDVGYHSPIPLHENQTPMPKGSCNYYDPCYYDGSSLCAKDLFDKFVVHGESIVWKELEEFYYRWLCKKD